MTRRRRVLLLPFALLLVTLSLACADRGEDDPRSVERSAGAAGAGPGGPSQVTPVTGPSWLHHLDLEISESRLGQVGGTEPQPGARGEEPELASSLEVHRRELRSALRRALSAFGRGEEPEPLVSERFRLTGADLYRLNCRSCHGPDGAGAPPEINSLLDPVRATSPEALRARMEARGATLDDDTVDQLTSQAETVVRRRLREGGERMPAFEHLRGDEVEALLGYLRELAGIDAREGGAVLVPQSAARVGEHLVKGTCHVCHDATGPGGHHAVMMGGIVPSLESFAEEYSLDSVLYKVERGSSGMMGMMGMGRRDQEMPAFPYLSREEVAAAYVYLDGYPPRP